MDQMKKSSLPSSPLQPSTSKPELLCSAQKVICFLASNVTNELDTSQYRSPLGSRLGIQKLCEAISEAWSFSVSHTSVSLCNSIKTLSM